MAGELEPALNVLKSKNKLPGKFFDFGIPLIDAIILFSCTTSNHAINELHMICVSKEPIVPVILPSEVKEMVHRGEKDQEEIDGNLSVRMKNWGRL